MADHGSGEGVLFPTVGAGRSTQVTAREVFAEAAGAIDADLARAIHAERDWRRGYVSHIRQLTARAAGTAGAGPAVAAAGLEALHRRFVFVRDGKELPLADAFELRGEPFDTATVAGSASHPGELTLPYRGELLSGDRLRRQFADWVAAGVIEQSCADALGLVADNPAWLDLSDLRFVLLGAGAQMGPLPALCRWGAEVLAVDLPSAAVTSGLVAAARKGCGRVLLPSRALGGTTDADIVESAGADLLTELPEIRQWLDGFAGPLVIGNYVYADGATFARLAMAADALMADVLGARSDVALAHLATPTDVFAVPEECVAEARRRTTTGSAASKAAREALRRGSGGKLYVPNYRETVATDDGRELGIADSLVTQQGPNYALAKRLQRWRATLARASGVTTSANVAPATRTRSVLKNRVLAAAYAGAHRFGVEVFAPETSSTLMAALLVHDLRLPAAPAAAAAPLRNPVDLLMHAAAHGGLWRVGWEPRSVLPLAALRGAVRIRR